MTVVRWRQRQADHNVDVSVHLGEHSHPHALDWQITTLFYAALQLVDTYLDAQGESFKSHIKRERALAHHSVLKTISPTYVRLKSLSRDARYDSEFTTIPPASLAQAQRHFNSIKEALEPHL